MGEGEIMRTGKDAAYPQGALTDCDIACGYMGGLLATHAWTPQEWEAQTARWRLPIFVPNTALPARQQAKACIQALRDLGVPPGNAYSLDLEAAIAPDWVRLFADTTHAAGWRCMVYGSPGTLFANPPRTGYWVANPTGSPHMYEHPLVRGTQYAWQTDWDLSLFDDNLALWEAGTGSRAKSATTAKSTHGGQ
jgi:hypothetical protein